MAERQPRRRLRSCITSRALCDLSCDTAPQISLWLLQHAGVLRDVSSLILGSMLFKYICSLHKLQFYRERERERKSGTGGGPKNHTFVLLFALTPFSRNSEAQRRRCADHELCLQRLEAAGASLPVPVASGVPLWAMAEVLGPRGWTVERIYIIYSKYHIV